MNLARVIGTVWATRKQTTLDSTKLLIVQPVDGDLKPSGRPLVAADAIGAGVGETVMMITAREAVLGLTGDLDSLTAVDATLVGIVDTVNHRSP